MRFRASAGRGALYSSNSGNLGRFTMNRAFLILTVISYGASLAMYLGFLNTGKKLIGRVATLFLLMGIVGHYFALLERSRGLHTVPYHDLYGSMSLFGWLRSEEHTSELQSLRHL